MDDCILIYSDQDEEEEDSEDTSKNLQEEEPNLICKGKAKLKRRPRNQLQQEVIIEEEHTEQDDTPVEDCVYQKIIKKAKLKAPKVTKVNGLEIRDYGNHQEYFYDTFKGKHVEFQVTQLHSRKRAKAIFRQLEAELW